MMATELKGGSFVRETKRALRSICPRSFLNWREARYYEKYGEVELHIVEYLCRRAQDSIDVGAHDGCYIHFMRKHSRCVYAFEPIPWLAKDLAKKFRRGVVPYNIALSRSAGTAVLRMPVLDGVLVPGCSSISQEASSNYPEHREIRVRMETLDGVYSGNVGFLKIDVEGHEEAVLDGSRKTIARCRPRMLIEIDERLSTGAVQRITDFLRRLDYRGFFIFQRQMMPIDGFDPKSMQRAEDLPDLKAGLHERERFGRYIYNFLFFPADEPRGTLRKIEDRIARM